MTRYITGIQDIIPYSEAIGLKQKEEKEELTSEQVIKNMRKKYEELEKKGGAPDG